MAKKIFVFLLMGLFIMSMVSAVWWNPFTWFQDKGVEVTKGEAWIEIFNDNPDFYSVIPDKAKHDADIYLCSKTAIKKKDLKDLDFATSFNNAQKEMKTKAKLKSIKYGEAYCYYYKPTKEERFLKFDKHSTHFIYTNESITATEDGVEIGEVSLITEDFNYLNGRPNIQMGFGKNLLTHTFYIENWVNESITNLRTVDLTKNQEVERNATLKFLTYEDVEVPTYDLNCSNITNSTGTHEVCNQYQNGTTTETKEKWITRDQAVEGSDYIAGVFANVENHDYIDIDFDYYGTSVLASPIDWATWTSDLNLGLVMWYDFEETTGTTVVDTIGNINGTLVGTITRGVAGVIGNAYSFDEDNGDYINTNHDLDYTQGTTHSISFWYNPTTLTFNKQAVTWGYLAGHTSDTSAGQITPKWTDDVLTVLSTGATDVETDYSLSTGQWYHIVVTEDGGTVKIYVNGTLEDTQTDWGGQEWDGGLVVGALRDIQSVDGKFDLFGYWNRTLSQAEVTQLYNNHNGINPTSDEPPTITNPQPANNTVYTTTTTVNFNATVSDDINLVNVSLMVDGAIDQTNTSGLNNSIYVFTKSLSSGSHNWSIIAYDNSSINTTTELRFINISIVSPTIELSVPADSLTIKNFTQTFYAYVYDNLGVENVSLYIDGVLNETDTSGLNATNYTFTKSFVDGSYNWYVKAYDNQGFSTDSATRTLTVNTVPFIEFLSPPTLVNYANITQEYVPMKVNVSTLYFKNITYNLQHINGTNYTQFYTNQTFDINFTDMPDGHYHYDVTVCTTTDKCNQTEIRHLNHDVVSPVVNITSPSLLNDLGFDGLSVTFTANFSDDALDSCWYNYNGTNNSFPCTNNQFNSTSFGLSNHDTDMIFYANDTFGNYLTESFDWDYMLYYINNSYEDPAVVGETSNFGYEAYWLNDSYSSINSYVNWNGERKSLATTQTSGDYVNATSSFLLTGLTVDTNVTFYWEFVIDGTFYNTSTYTQEVRTIKIDDCSNYSNYLFNFTLKDEETNTQINATNESGLIEVDLFINSDGSEILQYSSTESLTNPVYVCSELDLENRGFNFDLDVGFSSTDRVNEFYFVDEGDIETGDTPFNISLMDLKTTDSTSFLFNYFDVDGLPVDEAIVQVWRKYIGDGIFREVERAKSDQNGDTIVHLVEEDIIYYFQITLNDSVLYTSSQYTALCQATPCTIQIEASGGSATFPTDWDLIDNGAYLISSDATTRTVTMNYSLDDLGKMELTVYKYNSDGSYSAINTTSQTGTSGLISIGVPQSAGNVSFFATVEKDDEFINSEWVDFEEKAQDRMGVTLALFISSLIILTLGLMAISEGVGTLVFVILGVALSGFLGLMTVQLSTGVNIVVYLVIAGGVLLWKLTGGRR